MHTPTRSAWMKAWEADLNPSPAALRSQARVGARLSSTRHYGHKALQAYYEREATARLPEWAASPGRAAVERTALPELKVATQRRPRWGLVLLAMLFMALLLGVCVATPILVRAATTELESTLGTLQTTQEQLAAENSRLSAQVSALCSPDRLTEQAMRLGLVPAQSMDYLRLEPAELHAEGDSIVAGR